MWRFRLVSGQCGRGGGEEYCLECYFKLCSYVEIQIIFGTVWGVEREYCILSVVLLCNTCLCDFPHDVGGGSPQYSPIPINVEIYLHIRAVQHAHKHTNTHTLTHDIPGYSIFCYKRNISINGDLKIYLFKISIKLSYNY